MPTKSHVSGWEKNVGKEKLTQTEEGFGYRLSTHKKFAGEVGELVRTEMLKKLKNIVATTKGAIVGRGEAQSLAKHLLTEVSAQMAEIVAYISEQYQELVAQCNFSPDSAWIYIGSSLRAVFDSLSPFRCEFAALEDWSSAENKSQIIWATIQVHIQINSVIAAVFTSHQVVRVDVTTVEALETKVAAAVKTTTSVDKQVSSLDNDLKAHKTWTANEVRTLKQKINKYGLGSGPGLGVGKTDGGGCVPKEEAMNERWEFMADVDVKHFPFDRGGRVMVDGHGESASSEGLGSKRPVEQVARISRKSLQGLTPGYIESLGSRTDC